MDAAGRALVLAHSPSRLAFPAPHLGPIGAQSITHCPATPFSSTECWPQWTPKPRAAERPHRRCSRQSPATKLGPVEQVVVPRRFPCQERRRTRRNPATRAAGRPGDSIASPQIFQWASIQSKDLPVRKPKFPGASAQNLIFYSICDLLNLVNSLKIIENSEKCKPNFVGFAVKNPTTLIILD
jgi:hypothetical protein